jgi:hypothetical protein
MTDRITADLPPVWRIEAKATPFAPWIVIEPSWRLESAVERARAIKAAGRFYATRIRAN